MTFVAETGGPGGACLDIFRIAGPYLQRERQFSIVTDTIEATVKHTCKEGKELALGVLQSNQRGLMPIVG